MRAIFACRKQHRLSNARIAVGPGLLPGIGAEQSLSGFYRVGLYPRLTRISLAPSPLIVGDQPAGTAERGERGLVARRIGGEGEAYA